MISIRYERVCVCMCTDDHVCKNIFMSFVDPPQITLTIWLHGLCAIITFFAFLYKFKQKSMIFGFVKKKIKLRSLFKDCERFSCYLILCSYVLPTDWNNNKVALILNLCPLWYLSSCVKWAFKSLSFGSHVCAISMWLRSKG